MANLVLNGKSIDSIDDIAENFVEEDVLREFKSGSLASWLEEYGYEEELERVRSIKPTASSICVLAGISEALNLDDNVIAEAAVRREEQQRKEEIERKAREEQQRRDEEKRCAKLEAHEHEELTPLEKGCVDSGATAQEDNTAHVKLAEKCLEEGDFKGAVKHYRNAAEQGDADAQNSLGFIFRMGLGLGEPDDFAEAVKWYRKAAEQGHVEAQAGLGIMYKNGLGVPEDYAEAIKWFGKAIDQGGCYCTMESWRYVSRRIGSSAKLC